MLTLTEVFIALVTILLIVQFQKLQRASKRFPPGPMPFPIFGNLWTLKFNLHHETLMQLAKKYGNTFTVWAGETPVVVVNGYEAVRDALVFRSEDLSGRPQTPFIKAYAKEKGIIGANGHTWSQHRRFCMLTLRKLSVGKKSLECRIQKEARHMVENFASQKGRPVDPTHFIMSSVTNVIASVVFGHRFNIDDDTFRRLTQASTFVAHFMGSKWGQLYEALPSLMRHLPGHHNTLFMHLEYLNSYVKQEIRSHQKNPAEEPQDLIDFYLDKISKGIVSVSVNVWQRLSFSSYLLTCSENSRFICLTV